MNANQPLNEPGGLIQRAIITAKPPYMTQLHAWAEVAQDIRVSSQFVAGMQVPLEKKFRLMAVLTQEPGSA